MDAAASKPMAVTLLNHHGYYPPFEHLVVLPCDDYAALTNGLDELTLWQDWQAWLTENCAQHDSRTLRIGLFDPTNDFDMPQVETQLLVASFERESDAILFKMRFA